MSFNHIYTENTIYPKINIEGKRHYICPNGVYPSITTVLGSTADKSFLTAWASKIGEAEAARITNNSAKRGTNLHQMCEDYLNNKSLSVILPDALEMFYSIKPILNRINNIHCLETPLFCDRLKVSGTVDCIAEFDGVLSVIDFKNSRKPKKEEWIQDYFLQTCFYSLAYSKVHKVKQVVIIIAVENEAPQVFIKEPKDYIQQLLERVKKYNS